MENYYWLNKASRAFLERDYLTEGQTPEQRIRQIAEAAEAILEIQGFADKFESYMAQGFYSLATPVWTNFGTNRGLPVSCFNSHIEDTMDSILEKQSEVGKMSKLGGGTSGYFGELRPRGAKISVGGESSGPVHFMELFEKTADVVSQGSTRRGSFAAYLPIDHPDYEEFLRIRSEGHPIQNMSIGTTVKSSWMQELVDGNKGNRKSWGKTIEKKFESGYPYIIFIDNVNEQAPQVYKDKGIEIKSSNLCVTGDTLIHILVDEQEIIIQIKDLGFYLRKHGNVKVKSLNVTKGEVVFSDVLDFAQTGESIEMIEIEDEKGNILRCTPNHKIFTQNRGYVEAQFLREDDILENIE